VGICAFSGGNPHNTLSPIASKDGDEYTMDIILRNNITTEEYPDGVYHAHPEYFNIKKEGIGLIEAMGLFILPGRLKRQTAEIEKILTGEVKYNPVALEDANHDLHVHRFMIDALVKEAGGKVEGTVASALVTGYINRVCANILRCTAVFKDDDAGVNAFEKFTRSAGFEIKK
jgi:UDPglucose--hexose-1-phosphate uridylyltransferase